MHKLVCFNCVHISTTTHNSYTKMILVYLLCTGFQNHGRNFEAVANLIDGKSVTQVKNFFFNYKRKYNLLKHVSDYETRNVRMLM